MKSQKAEKKNAKTLNPSWVRASISFPPGNLFRARRFGEAEKSVFGMDSPRRGREIHRCPDEQSP
jgi:hypothetical protein